jgi:general L-amino acid transport system substrate-binding protein
VHSVKVGLSADRRVRIRPSRWLSVGLVAALGPLLVGNWSVELQAAEYRLCAFREGPDGPCSCHKKGDAAGHFTNVDEDNCGRRPEDDYYEDDSEAYVAPSYAPKGPVPPPEKSPRTQLAASEGDDAVTEAPTDSAESDAGSADAPKAPAAAEKAVAAEQLAEAKPAPAAEQPADTEQSTDAKPLTDVSKETASDKEGTASDRPVVPQQTAAAVQPMPPADKAAVEAKPKQDTLQKVQERGKLNCGVNTELLGFSALSGVGEWKGIDVDFCRAVAIAVLGSPDKVNFVPLHAEERFPALQQGRIDLLSRNTTWTMSRVVDLGVEFVGVSYFDGQGFLTRHDRGLVSAQQLDGLKVCVQSGTTSEANLDYYLKNLEINAEKIVFPHKAELLAAYEAGACDAYTADRSALLSERAGLNAPETHEMLPETISKEPLGPVVRQDDRAWIEIVRWTLAGLINAEEVRLTREKASGEAGLDGDMKRLVEGAGRSGKKLGLADDWLRRVVGGVGNYGEVFEANIGKSSPIGMDRGMNALWKRGGLLYAPPMW